MTTVQRSPLISRAVSKGRLLRFKKGQSIPVADESTGIMMISRGYVKRFLISNSGSLGIQIVYGPQDVFSLTKVYHNLLDQSLYDGPETYYYEAMCDTQLFILDITSLKETAERQPLIYKELFSEAGHHLKTCVHNIENISLATAYQRVAHQLLFFAHEFSKPIALGLELTVPLTHQDIADLVGVTRETVTLSMTKLRTRELVVGSRYITIKDVNALSTEVYYP
jgi:CRP/FNR family cyclic AMP-dependent transcriptional regulator